MIGIRKAESKDQASIWEIIQEVISPGDTYVFTPDSDREEMLGYWCGPDKYCYVAEIENLISNPDNWGSLGSSTV